MFIRTAIVHERIRADHDIESIHVDKHEPALQKRTSKGSDIILIKALPLHQFPHEFCRQSITPEFLPAKLHIIKYSEAIGCG